jgi:hypothetical protein
MRMMRWSFEIACHLHRSYPCLNARGEEKRKDKKKNLTKRKIEALGERRDSRETTTERHHKVSRRGTLRTNFHSQRRNETEKSEMTM